MKILDLYFYQGSNGAVQTLVQIPNANFTPMYRLVADDGKVLTKDDGKTTYSVIDISVEDKDNWKEIDKPTETK